MNMSLPASGDSLSTLVACCHLVDTDVGGVRGAEPEDRAADVVL